MRDRTSRDEKPNVRRKYLTPDQARRVIDAAATVGRNGERDKLLLTLIYRHGLRVSEAVDLRWSDFDLDGRQRTLAVRRLKGSKDSMHTLEPDTVRMLKRAQASADGLYVFRSERGGPMSVDAIQVICKRAGEAAGLQGIQVHPHMLRHACGFALAEEGTDTRLIQDYLGHRSIANTVIYTETSARRLATVRVR